MNTGDAPKPLKKAVDENREDNVKIVHSGGRDAAALDIIIRFEGFSATPYRCPAGVWTIGYGSTRTPQGVRVNALTTALTKDEALSWLRHDLSAYKAGIRRLITVPLSDTQFCALLSFTYNLGTGNLAASTLRHKLNRCDYHGAANEFPKWRFAAGRVLPGLVKRRAAERALFGM